MKNERILEIKAKALVPIQKDGYTSWVFSEDKFAELIVRECAEVAKHHVMNISTYADADFVDDQIKEHFGIEE